jgi:uncharacterized protein YndB with AHSA1/START domain
MSETRYTINRPDKKIRVERIFNAPRPLVWQTWTKPELLDQWWAPKPWKAQTKSMDFREGGSWLYSMNGPDGEQHWAKADYMAIRPDKFFSVDDYFTDSEGVKNQEMPGMHWEVNFYETRNISRVDITISFTSEAELDKIVEMGFKEGFAAAHDNLDALLQELTS